MDFGEVAVTGVAGTVTLNPVGNTRTFAGVAVAGTFSLAAFLVGGQNGAGFDITLPTSLTINRSGGGGTMNVNAFNSLPAFSSTIVGTTFFSVGATLNVGAAQPAGNYSGSFNVSVNYQ